MTNLLGLTNIKNKVKRYTVTFKGQKFIMIGRKNEGGLLTEEEYANNHYGKYYLYEDGKIRSNGEVVGTIKDIEFM